MNDLTKQRIKELIIHAMEKVIIRRTLNEPFDEDLLYKQNPFGARLVPELVWKGSKFERSFVTVLGQGIFEQIARIIAEGTGATAENGHVTKFPVCTFRITHIEELLRAQRSSSKSASKLSWNEEVEKMLSLRNAASEEVSVVSDIYIRRSDETEEFYSFKTVKPNLDQTQIAKKDMLLLLAGDSKRSVFFALPYNPAGEGNLYKNAGHSIVYRLLNIEKDSCVLIGSKLWNQIGQNSSTYDELLDLFSGVGKNIKTRISKEYFSL